MHERRRFTDVMDEEIDDERKRTALDRYTAGFVRSRMETCSLDMPRRVKQEVNSFGQVLHTMGKMKRKPELVYLCPLT